MLWKSKTIHTGVTGKETNTCQCLCTHTWFTKRFLLYFLTTYELNWWIVKSVQSPVMQLKFVTHHEHYSVGGEVFAKKPKPRQFYLSQTKFTGTAYLKILWIFHENVFSYSKGEWLIFLQHFSYISFGPHFHLRQFFKIVDTEYT